MRNLIKKILKESDFDWFEEIEQDPAKEFLYQKFMQCELVGSKKQPGWTQYIDPEGKILFLDNIETGSKNRILWFDYNEIYQKLLKMGLNYDQIKVLVKDMLWETHKRKVDTAYKDPFTLKTTLWETHKRKVDTAYVDRFTFKRIVVGDP